MKRLKNSFLILCFIAGALCLSSCATIKDYTTDDVKIDRETREPTNRDEGLTPAEDSDVDDANINHQNKFGNKTSNTSTTEKEREPEEKTIMAIEPFIDGIVVPSGNPTNNTNKGLINDDGDMRGSFINMSDRQAKVVITRIRTDNTEDEKVNESVAPMMILPYSLSMGDYRADVTVNGKTHCWPFTVRPSDRKNATIKVYDKKERTEIVVKINGFSYLLYQEKDKLIKN